MLYRRRRSSAFDDATKLIFIICMAIGLVLIWVTVTGIGAFQAR
ncbi:MAG TPA: hypothetical protein VEI26_16515 [Terriglobales bacterium]|nr:hypothetical protein [Terriglobales bacterium]